MTGFVWVSYSISSFRKQTAASQPIHRLFFLLFGLAVLQRECDLHGYQKKTKKTKIHTSTFASLTQVIYNSGTRSVFWTGFWDKPQLKVLLNGDYRWEIEQYLLGTRLNPRVWQKWYMASCSSFIRSRQIICSCYSFTLLEYSTELHMTRHACFGSFNETK